MSKEGEEGVARVLDRHVLAEAVRNAVVAELEECPLCVEEIAADRVVRRVLEAMGMEDDL